MTERWLFEVIQGGMVVAEGSCPDQHTAMQEAAHYVMMYGQDGDVQAIVRKPGEKRALRHKRRLLHGETGRAPDDRT